MVSVNISCFGIKFLFWGGRNMTNYTIHRDSGERVTIIIIASPWCLFASCSLPFIWKSSLFVRLTVRGHFTSDPGLLSSRYVVYIQLPAELAQLHRSSSWLVARYFLRPEEAGTSAISIIDTMEESALWSWRLLSSIEGTQSSFSFSMLPYLLCPSSRPRVFPIFSGYFPREESSFPIEISRVLDCVSCVDYLSQELWFLVLSTFDCEHSVKVKGNDGLIRLKMTKEQQLGVKLLILMSI